MCSEREYLHTGYTGFALEEFPSSFSARVNECSGGHGVGMRLGLKIRRFSHLLKHPKALYAWKLAGSHDARLTREGVRVWHQGCDFGEVMC